MLNKISFHLDKNYTLQLIKFDSSLKFIKCKIITHNNFVTKNVGNQEPTFNVINLNENFKQCIK
jgi:hypothetical protein